MSKTSFNFEENKNIYHALIENLTDSVFVVDRNLKIIFVNKHAATYLKMKKGNVIGKSINELFPGKIANRQVNQLKKVFSEGEIIHTVTSVEFPAGTVWLDNKIIPIKDDNNEVKSVFGVSRDITKQKVYEDEVLRYKGNLVELLKAKENDLKSKNEILDKSTIVFAGTEITIVNLKKRIKELEDKLKDKY